MAIKFLSGVNVDQNTLFVDDVNNRVGIGTGSPAQRLDVAGIARFRNSTSNYIEINGSVDGSNAAQISNRFNSLNIITNSGAGVPHINLLPGTSGNVGIGNTAPAHKLDISGDLNVNHTANVVAIRIGGIAAIGRGLNTDGTRINGGSTDGIEFTPNNDATIKMVIKPSGNVGIGTTSPDAKLHVASGKVAVDNTSSSTDVRYGGSLLALANSYSALDNIAAIDFPQSAAGSGFSRVGVQYKSRTASQETQDMFFVTMYGGASSERMRILGNGNVGIGTNSPSYLLDVNGEVHASGAVGNIGTNSGQQLELGSTALSTLRFDSDAWRIYAGGTGGSGELLRITETGNVGIGTTSPGTTLHIQGSSLTTGNVSIGSLYDTRYLITSGAILGYYASEANARVAIGRDVFYGGQAGIGFGGGGTFAMVGDGGATNGSVLAFSVGAAIGGGNTAEKMRITSAGNVGIGTTSPIAKLHLSDTTGGSIYMQDSDGATTHNISSISNNGNNFGIYTRSSNGTYVATDYQAVKNSSGTDYHRWFTNGDNERMRITSAGNVGIGTTSPSAKLEIETNDLVTRAIFVKGIDSEIYAPTNNGGYGVFSITSDVGSTRSSKFFVNAAGNVGIGTTTPSQILHLFKQAHSNDVQLLVENDGYLAGTKSSIVLKSKGTNGGSVTSGISNVQEGVIAGTLAFYTNGANERMRITTAGNVGIGTTSPGAKLDVNGTTYLRSVALDGIYGYSGNNIQFTNAGNTTFTGNVGIGTTSPSYKLDIAGDVQVQSAYFLRFANEWGIQQTGTNLNFAEIGSADGRLYLKAGGNVGIGTTSPLASLQVGSVTTSVYGLAVGKADIIDTNKDISDTQMGTLNVTSTSRSGVSPFNQGFGPSITFTQNGSGYVNGYERVIGGIKTEIKNAVNLNFASIMQFYTHNNTELSPRMTIDGSNGNVGIGTTSPSVKLEVNGIISANGDNSPSGPGLGFGDYPTGGYKWIQSFESQALRINPLGNNVLFSGSGNVGIGTTSPAAKLHVASGNIEIDNGQSLSSRTSGGSNLFPLIKMSGNAINVGGWEGSFMADLYLMGGNGAVLADFSQGNSKFFAVRGVSGSTPSEYMRVTSAGNVGIGTTSPSYKLDVNGQAQIVNGIVTNTGTPVKMIVSGGILNDSTEFRTGNGEFKIYSGRFNAAHQSFVFSTGDNYTSGSERMRITSAGNVGIGTTSPQRALNIVSNNAQIRISDSTAPTTNYWEFSSLYFNTNQDLFISNQSGTAVTINASLNVGIGTSSPSQALHVSGNIRVTGAYYDSNNEAGTSGQVLTSTGTGTDWKSLAEITGVDGTGTANYVAKWSDADSITNSQIQDNGTTVGVGVAPSSAKLTVAGSIEAGGKTVYTKAYGSLDTTGQAVAGISASGNGASALFQFTCNGGSGEYQKIIYACHNAGGTWFTRKVVDEGTNALDVVASANGATITFTFKGRTSSQSYSPRVLVEITGNRDASYL